MNSEYAGVENKCMWDSPNKLCAQLRKLMCKYYTRLYIHAHIKPELSFITYKNFSQTFAFPHANDDSSLSCVYIIYIIIVKYHT